MSRNKISGSKGLHVLNGRSHFLKPSLAAFSSFLSPTQRVLLKPDESSPIFFLPFTT